MTNGYVSNKAYLGATGGHPDRSNGPAVPV